jgi:hypothetical protein
MPIVKNKKVKKTKKALATKASKPKKNTEAYFECLKACCQQGIKPKKISQVAHECKSSALAINAKMSTQKAQAVKKIKQGYAQLGKGLNEFIKSK